MRVKLSKILVMENNNIRSFFAIPISSVCRQEINMIVLELKKDLSSDIKWVNAENLHLTLKFLGEFRPNEIPLIEKMLRPALSSFKQFQLSFQNFGVFPNNQKPKVIWIGIRYPKELEQIFQEIENAAENLGFPKEDRGFSPHITIGRVKNDSHDLFKIGTVIKNKYVDEICISHVYEVIFYRSNLTPTGPIYTKLFQIPLKP